MFIYPNAYLITTVPPENPDNFSELISGWGKENHNGVFFYFSPESRYVSIERNGIFMVIAGSAFNPFDGINGENELLEMLVQKYLISKDAFFEYINEITGRFILYFSNGIEHFVLNDAAGNRSCCYYLVDNSFVVCSHPQLIADIFSIQKDKAIELFVKSSEYKKKTKYLPGNATLYADVFMLTPNTLLNLKNKAIERYYPSRKKHFISDKNIISELASVLKRSFEMVLAKHKVAISLTAGRDSRLTLAVSKTKKDGVLFYTFVADGNEDEKKDAEIALKLAEKFNLNYKLINADKSRVPPEFIDNFIHITSGLRDVRQAVIAYALKGQFPDDTVQLKSNVLEVSKGMYRGVIPPFCFKRLALTWIFSFLYGINRNDKLVKAKFRDFIKLTQFDKIFKYKFPYLEMFHWEHRLGMWQSLHLMESDFAHDTMIIYNNRKIIEMMLCEKPYKRMQYKVHEDLIREMWPELFEVPINPGSSISLRKKINIQLWKIFGRV